MQKINATKLQVGSRVRDAEGNVSRVIFIDYRPKTVMVSFRHEAPKSGTWGGRFTNNTEFEEA